MKDPAGQQNLHEIVAPPPVPWWPPAPGWYAVLAVALVLLGWAGLVLARRHRANRYRREALRGLAGLEAMAANGTGVGGEALPGLPLLLKRTALTAFPRRSVAALSGAAWHRFLDESADMQVFTDGLGPILDRISYDPSAGSTLDRDETRRLFAAARRWLKRHRADTGSGNGRPPTETGRDRRPC